MPITRRWPISTFGSASDGHRRNPGTTADLVAAGLFVLLREGIMKRAAVHRRTRSCAMKPCKHPTGLAD